MEGPISGVRFIHKAILKEMDALEAAARELGANRDGQLASVRSRFDFIEKVVHAHAEGENTVWFPALDEVAPFISRAYVLDHEADQVVFGDIRRVLSQLSSDGGESERRELSQRAYRQIVALNATLSIHVSKEERQLVPFTEERFSREAQGSIVSRSIEHVPLEMRLDVLAWVLNALDSEEQAEYLRSVMEGMPPEAFRGALPRIKGGLPTGAWKELTRRVPELAALSG